MNQRKLKVWINDWKTKDSYSKFIELADVTVSTGFPENIGDYDALVLHSPGTEILFRTVEKLEGNETYLIVSSVSRDKIRTCLTRRGIDQTRIGYSSVDPKHVGNTLRDRFLR